MDFSKKYLMKNVENNIQIFKISKLFFGGGRGGGVGGKPSAPCSSLHIQRPQILPSQGEAA